MDTVKQLIQDVPIPRMSKVRQIFDDTGIPNVESEVRKQFQESEVLESISKGDKVAIAVGSRGVADIPTLTREVVNAIKSVGGDPFIVPAMGSHGGATAEGQLGVLKQLGVTEASVHAPIRSSMEVVEVGRLSNGLPIYIDKNAYTADKIVVINRVKPHTAFRGKAESGLLKMITIGLGKQKGAEAAHSYGFKYMAEHVPEMAKIVLQETPIIFGLATVENAYDRPAKIRMIPAHKMVELEPDLLLEAKTLMPSILFDPIDVLIVDELGKDISGDGMDPNITGRYPTPYASGGPSAKRIAVLGLTEKTHGNANGIGLADMTTKKVFETIDLEQGYANALTSTVVGTVKVPMVLDTEELAVKAAIKTSNAFDLHKIRMVRIKNTLDIKEIEISESLVPEARTKSNIELLTEPNTAKFLSSS
ncbi:lactate racemase domain-containing protein [Tuberibacillus sp. Marseille-P3662]|uniref:lactate racemase domain-containing protein n=1 Tax=Tuberibacillus sp. Marseille-P3662 TaxID=1965358 RepID=UPI000A1C93EA|nr:lactate racemase domain-containing protein [Tuberibacillus sp. Marseille-P3662]